MVQILSGAMIIKAIPSGPYFTNAYVFACSETRKAVIVDPSPKSAPKITAYLDDHSLEPIAILLTHSHWDHIADVAELKALYSIPVCVHALDLPNLENPGADQLPCSIPISGVRADVLIQEGSKIEIGLLCLEVIHTPGHSVGSVCFFEKNRQILFSGDTLFRGTIGNISFPTSDPESMWTSLKKIAQLPPTTVFYPGHGATSTLGRENWLADPQKYFG